MTAMIAAPWIEELGRRRDFVCRNPPRCEACNSVQVQIIDIDPPAKWKCRICKCRFVYEPEAT